MLIIFIFQQPLGSPLSEEDKNMAIEYCKQVLDILAKVHPGVNQDSRVSVSRLKRKKNTLFGDVKKGKIKKNEIAILEVFLSAEP